MNSRFRITTGTVQIFIVCNDPWLFVPASMASYDSSRPVGSKWERAVAQWVCDYFNELEDVSNVTEKEVERVIALGKKSVAWIS